VLRSKAYAKIPQLILEIRAHEITKTSSLQVQAERRIQIFFKELRIETEVNVAPIKTLQSQS